VPRAAPRPCPGCQALITGRASRCPKCVKVTHRRIDERRGSAHARGYGRRWRKVRLAALAREPLCRMCGEAGRLMPANEVDHIDGDSGNNREDNLRPLCKSCHSGRTARDQAFGRSKR